MKGQGLNDLPHCELERRSSHHKGIFFEVPYDMSPPDRRNRGKQLGGNNGCALRAKAAVDQTFKLLWSHFGALKIQKNWQSVSCGMEIRARRLGIQIIHPYEAKILDI
jgi:hypothetical protein